MHLFKLKRIKIDNEMKLFEKQNEIGDCSFKEQVDECNKLIDSCKDNLEKLRNEIPKIEELCDCFESIRLYKENEEIFDFDYWYNFFNLERLSQMDSVCKSYVIR